MPAHGPFRDIVQEQLAWILREWSSWVEGSSAKYHRQRTKYPFSRTYWTRDVKNVFSSQEFATSKMDAPLPVLIYRNKSLMRRVLGNVDPLLQENKVINLALSAPKVTNVLIRPGETFSFWKLAGRCSEKEGYKKGLVISSGKLSEGIGGGMCQFTNLVHFLVLHSPMDIVEHHHHDEMDLFPDFGRQIPFGTGTSIMYNYLDYRFKKRYRYYIPAHCICYGQVLVWRTACEQAFGCPISYQDGK